MVPVSLANFESKVQMGNQISLCVAEVGNRSCMDCMHASSRNPFILSIKPVPCSYTQHFNSDTCSILSPEGFDRVAVKLKTREPGSLEVAVLSTSNSPLNPEFGRILVAALIHRLYRYCQSGTTTTTCMCCSAYRSHAPKPSAS